MIYKIEKKLLPKTSQQRVGNMECVKTIVFHEPKCGLDRPSRIFRLNYYVIRQWIRGVFKTGSVGFHYIVDDKHIVQLIDDNIYTYHCGNPNINTCSIAVERVGCKTID